MSIVPNSSENCKPQAADAAVFTIFRATYPISKRFKLNGGGLEKFAALPIGKGTAHLIHIASLDDLACLLDKLGANEAVGFGVPRCLADKPGAAFVGITTKEKAHGAACIPRLKETFAHPEGLAVWWGDIDRAKGQDEVPDAAEIDATLCVLLPWWSGIDRFYRPSVSAHISHGGKRLSGRTGMRVYALIDKGVNSEAVLAIVADALWKNGGGRIEHSDDGKRLVRCLFDLSKASPESLDYAGQPVFETAGLAKDYVAPVFYGPSGAAIDSGKVIAAAGIGRLTISEWRKQSAEVQAALEAALPAEKRLRKAYVETKCVEDVSRAKEAAAARGEPFDEDAARKRSRALWSGACRDALSPDFVIELQDGSRVTVAEILANIERFSLQYCRDPIEPGYNGGHASVAQIHAHDKPHIWSFAHGGRYYSLEDRRESPQERQKPEPRGVNGGGASDEGVYGAGDDAAVEGETADAGTQADAGPVTLMNDFYSILPVHQYLFVPARSLWPAASVNGRYGKNASQWLDTHRAAEALTWAPGEPLVIENRLMCGSGWVARQGCRTLNLYRPPVSGHGDPQDVGLWLDHIRRIYPDGHEHLIGFLAHRVQRPQEKINHAIVLGGEPGIGKDTILEPVKHAVGPWNFSEVAPRQLLGRFNGFLKCTVLRLSEARDLGDFDRFAFYETMKTYLAAPPDTLQIDEKNIREYQIVNVLAAIITTNHRADGLYLPPDDRRHYCLWSDSKKEDFPESYWNEFWRWYSAGGLENVAALLRTRDLSQPVRFSRDVLPLWIVRSGDPGGGICAGHRLSSSRQAAELCLRHRRHFQVRDRRSGSVSSGVTGAEGQK